MIIPIEGSIDYFTVEVRKNGSEGGIYDGNLPGSGVIIHAVLESRHEPAHLIGREGSPRGEEAWQTGETFRDIENGVEVSVIAAEGNGYRVLITSSGVSDESPEPELLAAPELVSPSNGSVVTSTESLSLVFNEVEGATRYQVQLTDALAGTVTINDTNISPDVCVGGVCTYVVPGLEPQEGASWRVRARGAVWGCLLYTSPSPRDRTRSRMPSSA